MDCNQKEVCEEKFKRIDDKFYNMNDQIKTIDKKVSAFEDMKDILTELKIISKQGIEADKSRDETREKHSQLLNDTANALKDVVRIQNEHNDKFDIVFEKIGHVDTKIDTKIGEIKNEISTVDNKSKVDLITIIKKGGWVIIVALLSGATGWILSLIL